jgi:hypothetical protein
MPVGGVVMSTKNRWLVGALIALAGLLLLLFVLIFPAPPDRHPNESIVRVSQAKPSQVRLQARLDRNWLEDGSVDRLQITVTNDSQQPLTSLHLSLIAPGFVLKNQDHLSCNSGGTTAGNQLLPHQDCLFEVELFPAAKSGVYGIAATLYWNASKVAGHTTLLLDPVTIDRMFGAAAWSRAARRITGLLKDLTLPIIIVVLGALLGERQKARDDARITADTQAQQRRIEAEKVKEEANRVARSEQDERQEVRQQLLTRVMYLAGKHYLLFVSHAKLILIEAEKIRDQHPDAARDKLFLQVLFLLKRMEEFRLTEGGLFFKTRDAERAVSAAWYLLKVRINAAMGDKNIADALKIVESDWDYATFRARLIEFDQAWIRFEKWLNEKEDAGTTSGSFWQLLGLVDAFQAVIAFEADKALSKHWYEEDGKLEFVLPPPTVLYHRLPLEPFEERKVNVLQERLDDSYSRGVEVKTPQPDKH